MSHKEGDWLEEGVKEDFEYFKKHVERGVKKLAGARTKERVNKCFHCKLWRRADKFIKDVVGEND